MPKIPQSYNLKGPERKLNKKKHNFSLNEFDFEMNKKLKMPHRIEGWQ